MPGWQKTGVRVTPAGPDLDAVLAAVLPGRDGMGALRQPGGAVLRRPGRRRTAPRRWQAVLRGGGL